MIKEEDNVRTLLKYFQEVKDRYYKDKPEDTFNIFAAMRRKTEEVALHSRFIASLLDPYAPHGLDDVPLRLFLDTIGLDHQIITEDDLEVQPGYEEKSEYNNIDILVTSDTHAIIIENKINHHDTNHEDDYVRSDGRTKLKGQLERYYHVITKEDDYLPENTEVVYLTPEGKLPSSISTGGDNPRFPELAKKVKCISYQKHIKSWLKQLLDLKEIDTKLRYSIEQYITIIDELTMDELEVKENKALRELFGNLSQEEKELYDYLKTKEVDVCWHTADELLHDIIRYSSDKPLKVASVQWDDEGSREEEHFNQLIAGGLTDIISYGRGYHYLVLYFDTPSGLFPFIGMDTKEYFFIGIETQYKNPNTDRHKKIPQSVQNYLDMQGFKTRNDDIIKPIQYEDAYLDSNELSGLTLKITNDEERQKYVLHTYQQFCDMVEALEGIMKTEA